MNYEMMKQLIENANTDVERDAYIEAFETMSGFAYETLFMSEEERKANLELYELQQDEYEPIEFVQTFTDLQ